MDCTSTRGFAAAVHEIRERMGPAPVAPNLHFLSDQAGGCRSSLSYRMPRRDQYTRKRR